MQTMVVLLQVEFIVPPREVNQGALREIAVGLALQRCEYEAGVREIDPKMYWESYKKGLPFSVRDYTSSWSPEYVVFDAFLTDLWYQREEGIGLLARSPSYMLTLKAWQNVLCLFITRQALLAHYCRIDDPHCPLRCMLECLGRFCGVLPDYRLRS